MDIRPLQTLQSNKRHGWFISPCDCVAARFAGQLARVACMTPVLRASWEELEVGIDKVSPHVFLVKRCSSGFWISVLMRPKFDIVALSHLLQFQACCTFVAFLNGVVLMSTSFIQKRSQRRGSQAAEPNLDEIWRSGDLLGLKGRRDRGQRASQASFLFTNVAHVSSCYSCSGSVSM